MLNLHPPRAEVANRLLLLRKCSQAALARMLATAPLGVHVAGERSVQSRLTPITLDLFTLLSTSAHGHALPTRLGATPKVGMRSIPDMHRRG